MFGTQRPSAGFIQPPITPAPGSLFVFYWLPWVSTHAASAPTLELTQIKINLKRKTILHDLGVVHLYCQHTGGFEWRGLLVLSNGAKSCSKEPGKKMGEEEEEEEEIEEEEKGGRGGKKRREEEEGGGRGRKKREGGGEGGRRKRREIEKRKEGRDWNSK